MNYKFPEHLMTKEYIQKQINIMDKILSRAENPKNITDAELKKALFSAEQIDLLVRSILSERFSSSVYLPYEFKEEKAMVSIKLADDVLEIKIPPTVKRQGKESWYIATMVRAALKEYTASNKAITLRYPVMLVCERIIPSEKTVVRDNDSIELDRVVNECIQFIGFSDHPLKMSYMSVTKVKEGERYTKISVMEEKKFLEIAENILKI